MDFSSKADKTQEILHHFSLIIVTELHCYEKVTQIQSHLVAGTGRLLTTKNTYISDLCWAEKKLRKLSHIHTHTVNYSTIKVNVLQRVHLSLCHVKGKLK